MISIQSQVPVPIARHRGSESQQLEETMRDMKVGDSFLYQAQRLPYRIAEEAGMKIITRKVNGDGFRIWRVK